MRKITSLVTDAFLKHERKSVGNTLSTGDALFLHGNKIAEWRGDELWITLAGWPTVTTRERLNALPGVTINQRKRAQFLNGQPWDGSWFNIGKVEYSPLFA